MIEKHESLFHSRFPFALTTNILHPMEVIDAVIHTWKSQEHTIGIKRSGDRSCPVNSLYGDFLHRHQNTPRMGMTGRTGDNVAQEKE